MLEGLEEVFTVNKLGLLRIYARLKGELSKAKAMEEVAVLLKAHGVTMEPRPLINRINRGHFTFEFALQVLAGLGGQALAAGS